MLDRVLLRPVDWDPLTILAAEDLPHVDIDALEAAMRRGGGPTRDDVTTGVTARVWTRRRSPGSGWKRSYVSDAPSQPLSADDDDGESPPALDLRRILDAFDRHGVTT